MRSFTLRKQPCKHIIATRLVCERDHGGKAPAIVVDSVPKRPTYKKNWPAYDKSQFIEKRRLQVMLAELCSCIPEPPRQTHLGRKPVPIADRLFGIIFKVSGSGPSAQVRVKTQSLSFVCFVLFCGQFLFLLRHFCKMSFPRLVMRRR